MLEHNTKCECGHQNPVGTVLCESCGKPLTEENDTAPLEMRYDGIARRSQKVNPNIIDRIWRFFSSVKIAVWLIVLTLLASIIGSIYPQAHTLINIDPAQYYADNYGKLGSMYHMLGFSNTFRTWWFQLLLVMIGASLVICSLDRVLPLYRALSKQQIRKHLQFLTRQRVVYEGELAGDSGAFLHTAESFFKKRGYRVHTDKAGTALLAERHRFSRWGPYINHIGLIIFLLALLFRGFPGFYMDQYMGFMEGEPVPIPDTPYYLLNEQFTVEFYTEDELPEEFRNQGRVVPSFFETKAVLYECVANCDSSSAKPELVEVTRHNIEVNKPLKYKGLLAYQFDFRQTPYIREIKVMLTDNESGEAHGPISLSTINPQEQYIAGPFVLTVKDYIPDFGFNEEGIFTKTRTPQAPAFVFLIEGPGLPDDGEVFIYFPREVDKQYYSQDILNGELADRLHIGARSMEDVSIVQFTSYLNIRMDRVLPFIMAGGVIFIIGVALGIYWQHRRIWIRIDDGRRVTIGGHTNKNWYGLRVDLAKALQAAGIQVEQKQLDNGVKQA